MGRRATDGLMFSRLGRPCARLSLLVLFCLAHLVQASQEHVSRQEKGIHIPIFRGKGAPLRRRGLTGSIGLGDYLDITYNVRATIGGVSVPLVLDTGSSDLWVISDACAECSKETPSYPQETFQSVGLDVSLLYGDSRTGTHAFGLIGKDTVTLAGLRLENQFFAAINNTNTTVEQTGSAGIFGLGFPINSVIWSELFANSRITLPDTKKREAAPRPHPRPSFDLARRTFPNITKLHVPSRHKSRQTSQSSLAMQVFSSYPTIAPFLSRLVAANELSAPIITVTLQRDYVDFGGNAGLLSIGSLPGAVSPDSLTWVPVRAYSVDEGGLPPPPDSPNEKYPYTWEIPLEGIFLDGQALPRSTLAAPNITLSALLDTGNSLLRGPADVVTAIVDRIGAHFPCSEPHTLAYRIGGKMFPVDPRDFIRQSSSDGADICQPAIAATDPPEKGRYLYSWSLGDPFLKSVLASFYFGNLTHPSQDPPRIGLLSTVPPDAGEKLKAVVTAAAEGGGDLLATSESAPAGPPRTTRTNSNGVPEAEMTSPSRQVHTSGSTGSRSNMPMMMASWGWLIPFLILSWL